MTPHITEAALEILTAPTGVHPELRRKLEYVANELESGRRDEKGITFLVGIQREIVAEHGRRMTA